MSKSRIKRLVQGMTGEEAVEILIERGIIDRRTLKRLSALEQFDRARKQGDTCRGAAMSASIRAGMSERTVWRYRKKYRV